MMVAQHRRKIWMGVWFARVNFLVNSLSCSSVSNQNLSPHSEKYSNAFLLIVFFWTQPFILFRKDLFSDSFLKSYRSFNN
jgi:hypothetical protein